MPSEELYEFGCIKKAETHKALLVLDPATGEQIWFPRSHVKDHNFDGRGEGTLTVTAWIAKQKGLI